MAEDPRVADIVQAGRLRVAVFLPQYTKDSATGVLRGIGMGFVAIEMGRALAARLGVELLLVENPTPLKAAEGLKTGAVRHGMSRNRPIPDRRTGFLAPGCPI